MSITIRTYRAEDCSVPQSSIFTIRLAEKQEFEDVRFFYHSLIDAMKLAQYKPGWEKDVYPSNKYLHDAIHAEQLYIGTIGDEITCAMIVNHIYNESYVNTKWPTDAMPEEITIIHALGVHPNFSGRGLAKKLVTKAIALAKESRQKVIRLDVLGGNVPAEKLYTGLGFQYIDTIQMYYEDTGWTDFKLYEYPVR